MLQLGTKVKLSREYRTDFIQPEGFIYGRSHDTFLVTWTDLKGTDQHDGPYEIYSLDDLAHKKHIHYELIILWADGKTIQLQLLNGSWRDIVGTPKWDSTSKYRLKPELQDIIESLHKQKDRINDQIKKLEVI